MHFICFLVYGYRSGDLYCMCTLHSIGVRIQVTWLTCLHQKASEMHTWMRRHNKSWCTHVGQEIPVLVYALLMCKLVGYTKIVTPGWQEVQNYWICMLTCLSFYGLVHLQAKVFGTGTHLRALGDSFCWRPHFHWHRQYFKEEWGEVLLIPTRMCKKNFWYIPLSLLLKRITQIHNEIRGLFVSLFSALCNALASRSIDKCHPVPLVNSEYSTRTAHLMRDAFGPLHYILNTLHNTAAEANKGRQRKCVKRSKFST